MIFLNTFAFAGLLLVPALIALYMFKQKNKIVNISSTYLWKKLNKQNDNQKSLRKLKNNILMFLQIIIIIALVTALAKPQVIKEGQVNNSLILIDCSASMQTKYENSTRFEHAKKLAVNIIKDLKSNSNISVIELSSEPNLIVNNIDDRDYAIDKINDIKCTNESIDFNKLTAILGLFEKDNINIYSFSDNEIKIEDYDINNNIVNKNDDNIAITSIMHNFENDGINVLVKIKNFGDNTIEKDVNLYADDKIFDYQTIKFNGQEEKNVIFKGLNLNLNQIKVSVNSNDLLECDDIRFSVVNQNSIKRIFLGSENLFFIQKALSVIPNVEIYKGDDKSFNDLKGYDVYIFDGKIPDKIPNDGQIIIFNPEIGNTIINTEEDTKVSNLTVKNTDLLKFISDINFYISKSKKMTLDENWTTIISSNETPLVALKQEQFQKILVFGFEINNTDLALKKEFPIFIYNIVNYLSPKSIFDNDNIMAGESIKINSNISAQSVEIITPEGRKINLNSPITEFSDTNELGIYKVIQNFEDRKEYSSFAVNVNTELESNLKANYYEDNLKNDVITSKAKSNVDIQWILIVVAVILMLIEFLIYNNYKLKFDVLRTIVIILALTSIVDIHIDIKSGKTDTVFLADVSKSVDSEKNNIVDFINNSIKNKSNKDYTGMVCFAENAKIENSINDYRKSYSINSFLNSNFTDISEGLNFSTALFNEGRNKRILLFSDGLENSGSAVKSAQMLKSKGIVIDVVPTQSKIEKEVQISKISVPENIVSNMNYNIGIEINSLVNTKTNLTIYRQNDIISNQHLDITKGKNNFVINDIINDISGTITYKAEIKPEIDTIFENNVVYGYSYINDVPNILIIKNENGDKIEEIIKSSKVNYNLIDAFQAPENIEELNKYNLIIISDCEIDSFSEKFLNNISNYVKNLGGGLLVTGGENSFALGNYKDTILEDILPVKMDLKNKNEIPEVGIVIVVDRSSSMDYGRFNISKLELAKEAIINSLDNITQNDSIGVLSFDDFASWNVEIQKVGNDLENIKNKVSQIGIGGGTNILSGLNEAYNKILNYDVGIKHIILLTDGQDTSQGYNNFLKNINSNDITLSTIAVGEDADKNLMQHLASNGNGRYYFTNQFTDLPKIFAKETNITAKSYINNGQFYPKTSESEILNNISELPAINGYIRTTSKNTADVVLSNDDEPILALWQYGLGKTAVWTSDFNNWTNQWFNDDNGVNIIKNTISFLIRKQNFDDINISYNIDGKNVNLNANFDNITEIDKITGSILGDNYESNFEMDNNFKATVAIDKPGIYVANINVKEKDKDNFTTRLINIPYSSEFNIDNIQNGIELLNQIAKITNGKVIEKPEDVFYDIDIDFYDKIKLNSLFIVLALILFFTEIALRRFNINVLKINYNNYDKKVKKRNIFMYNIKEVKNNDNETKDTSELLVLSKNKRKKNNK